MFLNFLVMFIMLACVFAIFNGIYDCYAAHYREQYRLRGDGYHPIRVPDDDGSQSYYFMKYFAESLPKFDKMLSNIASGYSQYGEDSDIDVDLDFLVNEIRDKATHNETRMKELPPDKVKKLNTLVTELKDLYQHKNLQEKYQTLITTTDKKLAKQLLSDIKKPLKELKSKLSSILDHVKKWKNL